MVRPPWLEALHQQLQQQALPPQYLERLLQELRDHFQDIQEEKNGMDAEKIKSANTRMGDPNELAQFIASEYRQQYFSQRHPIVMFALMPVLLLLATWAGLALLDFIIERLFGEVPAFALDSSADQLICYALIWLPVTLITVIFCRSARHRQVNWRWPLLTAATLAFFPGLTVRLTPSALTIGLFPAVSMTTFIQLMLPLAIGGGYSWRAYRLQRMWHATGY